MQKQTIGGVAKGKKLSEITGLNPDFDLPCFNPGRTDEELDRLADEHDWKPEIRANALPMPKGTRIAGVFERLEERDEDQRYAVLRDAASGNLFRTWTPGQLAQRLRTQVKPGQYVEIEYLGKEKVELMNKKKGKLELMDVHQFKVEAEVEVQ